MSTFYGSQLFLEFSQKKWVNKNNETCETTSQITGKQSTPVGCVGLILMHSAILITPLKSTYMKHAQMLHVWNIYLHFTINLRQM